MKVKSVFIAVLLFLFFTKPVLAVELLSDGFESGTGSWSSSGGGSTATVSAELARTGSYSLKVQHDKTSSYGFQKIISNTEGAMFYRASGYGKTTDANVSSYFIRVAWYASTDGSGSQLSSPNDSNSLTTINGDWVLLTTDSIQAPSTANSAKIRLVLNSALSGQTAYVYFDDILFEESIAPTSAPTPTPTSTPTSAPTPTPTKTPTPTPVPNTPTPTLKSSATPTPGITQDTLGESTESGEKLLAIGGGSLNEAESISSEPPSPSSNWLQKISISIGGILLIACAILSFRFYMRNKKQQEV